MLIMLIADILKLAWKAVFFHIVHLLYHHLVALEATMSKWLVRPILSVKKM